MARKRDTSRDGFKNKLQTFVLTNFKWFWNLVQSNQYLQRKVNKALINNAIYKIPTRPYPFSLMTIDPFIPDTDDGEVKKRLEAAFPERMAKEYWPAGKLPDAVMPFADFIPNQGGLPKKTDNYTSWDSLSDRTYTGRHLPPNPGFNLGRNLPPLTDLAVLFRQRKDGDGKPITIYSDKSTLLFPYWVQWFTDGFLRTDRHNKLRNTSNHHIDLCTVYGLNRKTTHMLRSFQGGKLKSQWINNEEYPLFVYADPEAGVFKPEFEDLYQPLNGEEILKKERKATLFAMGVERANVQIGFVMLNVLCLREHNRLCGLLAQSYPDWDDERLFQTARNILMVEIMKIVVEDYINHITPYHFRFITDPPSFTNERWYRENWMTLEFSLVYRWHSALPQTLLYGGQRMPMGHSLWNNQMLFDQGIGTVMEETCSQAAARIGLFNTPDFPVGQRSDGSYYTYLDVTELASIKLGRLAQMASYNDYRAMCGFPRVTRFEQITSDPEAQDKLRELYGHVDKVEFYVGLYAEDVRENSALAPLIGRLVGIDAFSQALTNPLLAENVFNPDTFSPVGWDVIHNTKTLADLVERNTPRVDQPRRVTFYQPGHERT